MGFCVKTNETIINVNTIYNIQSFEQFALIVTTQI